MKNLKKVEKAGKIGCVLIFLFIQLSLYAQESLSALLVLYDIPLASEQDLTVGVPSEGALQGLLMRKLRKSSSGSNSIMPKKESHSYSPGVFGREKPVYQNSLSGGGGSNGAGGGFSRGGSSLRISESVGVSLFSTPMLRADDDWDEADNPGDSGGEMEFDPVGDSWTTILLLTGFYVIYVFVNKKKRLSVNQL